MSTHDTQEPIAIIGMGCRFPGSSDTPSKLWDLLKEPRDVLRTVPSTRRWNADAFFHEDPEHHGTSNVRASYFLDEDPADFDNNFFNIQPAEAESIDPQQRMLMETVYDALCSAGQTIEGLRGSPTAILVGAMGDDWSGANYKDWEALPQYAATGTGRSIMSNRVSYFFDWRGTSITLDTACSSSLVAVHLGIQAIRAGESRVAVAAGTNLILTPAMYLAESNLHMVSPSGRSKMWDKDVDGYGRGEGVAAVVLKSLSAAIEDGDHIECIIRATGVNQDGKSSGMTMPNPLAQADLIRDTYARAGLDLNNPADRPQFFHAHGTGTPAGDPREAEAIFRAFYSHGANDKLYVGSIKTIIGHTEGTAGLASLIGSVLSVKNGVILPNMHFGELNPRITPFYDNLEVPTVAKPWPKLPPGQPRRASINSFGFGGTNAHAIIESYEANPSTPSVGTLFTPLTISAATNKSLRDLLSTYSTYLQANPGISLRDFAYTLQERRSTLAYRSFIAASTVDQAVQKIDAILEAKESPELAEKHFAVSNTKVLGVFTGQGAQWPQMGAGIVKASPFMAEKLKYLDSALASLPETDRPQWTLENQLFEPASSSRVYEAALSQPLCTAVQILLVDMLELAGIRFEAVVGHSSGEIAAAYAAGFLSARDAIITAYYRGFYTKLAKSPNGMNGAMMVVGSSLEEAVEFCELDDFRGKIQVAAQNSPSSITLTGDEDAIDLAVGIFKDKKTFARKLKVDTAYHSSHMLPCAGPYLAAVEVQGRDECSQNDDAPVWYSSVYPGRIMSSKDVDSNYWVENLTKPVMFSQAISEATYQSGLFDLALEVGPHPALKGPCLDTLEVATGNTVPYSGILSREKDDVVELSSALGFVWSVLGADSVSFEALEKVVSGSNNGRNLISDLPKYPWDHSRQYWKLSRLSGFHLNAQTPPNPLLGRRCVDRDTTDKVQWRNMLKPKEIPWLNGHQLQGQTVFPASGYISMAVEAITAVADPSKDLSLINVENFTIDRGISFADDDFVIESLFALDDIRASEGEVTAKFSLYCGSPYDGTKPMTVHASGEVSATFGASRRDALPHAKMDDFNMSNIDVDRFYGQFEPVRYKYTEPFRGIRSIKRKNGYATGTLEDQTGSEWEDHLLIHPAMLDSAFQTGFAAWCCPGDGQLWCILVPSRIKSVNINPYFTSRGIGKQKFMSWDCWLNYANGIATQDTTIFSEDNYHTFIQVQGLEASPLTAPNAENDVPIFSRFDHRVDRPDGNVAGIDEPAVLEVEDDVVESDRLAFYYIRQLAESISAEERENALPHYRHLLNWAHHVLDEVKNGRNEFLPIDCLTDREERFAPFLERKGHTVDIRLIQSVGQNLPTAIRSNSSILEYMTKNGMLDSVYEEGLGLDQPNRCMAHMASLVGHRYPRMNVFEIGAGTGGSTRFILPKLGDYFSTYTYTDVSGGFFDAAQERFKDYSDRMIYKTYNMEKTPARQDFVEGSYDLVLASYVLHATNTLDATLANIRALLKPGGYAIIQELTSNDVLRISLPMAGLPGWWAGADNGRPWGPALGLSQWDALLRECGFSGIDSVTPRNHALYPDAVFVTQALDDRVSLLRSPLTYLETLAPPTAPQLLIVGGETAPVQTLVDALQVLLSSRYSNLFHIRSFEDLNGMTILPNSTMLVLSELEGSIMASHTPDKHLSFQTLWREAGMVLWVTLGSRSESPHSFMTVGLGRCMRYEHPNITLQILDFDTIDEQSPSLIAEELLRFEALILWEKDVNRKDLLWSIEPEVYLESGRRMIPRLKPNTAANDRYNTVRRRVATEIDPRTTFLVFSNFGSSYEPQVPSPLRLATLPPVPGETRSIRVSHFILQTIEVASAGRFMLCAGVDEKSGDAYIALSLALESPALVLADFSLPLDKSHDPAHALAAVAAHLIASNILKLVSPGGLLLIHEPETILFLALEKQAQERSVRLFTTTSSKTKAFAGWQYIHGHLPHRYASRALPSLPTAFVDLSLCPASNEAADLIRNCIPDHCATFTRKNLVGSIVEFRPQGSRNKVAEQLRTTWQAVKEQSFNRATDLSIIALEKAIQHSAVGEHLAVVDCCSPVISATLQAVDTGTIFKSDKTYFLVGLSGEVGQSLCQWMVQHGAKHVVMTSRKPKVNPKFIESMELLGASIRVLPCDATNRDSLQRCHQEICQTMPPIAGVANGAMVLRDTLFDKMTFDDLTAVLNPKVVGTQLLDEIFHDNPLDFFIALSSLTAIVGNSGQSNYTCANMYMIALTAQRKKRGLAGSAMALSSLIGLGFVERSEELDEDYFAKLGHYNISERDLHEQFAEAIIVGKSDYIENSEIVSGLVPIYADAKVKARWRTDVRFNHMVMVRPGSQTYAGQVVDMPVRARLTDAKTLQDASTIIKDSFVARLKRIMMISDEENVNEKVSLVEQGIDSLMAVEIRTWFLKELDVDMPVLKVISGGSILDLLAFALENIPKSILEVSGLETGPLSKPPTKPSALQIPKPVTPPVAKRATSLAEFSSSPSTSQFTPRAGSAPSTPLETPLNELEETLMLGKPKQGEMSSRMSFGQERFWFLNDYLDDKKTFNMAMMFKLTGSLDVSRVESALHTVTQRHEALRTRFFWSGQNGERTGMQGVQSDSPVRLVSKTIASEAEAKNELEKMHEVVWDLDSFETIKISLLSLSDNIHYFVCGSHHISLDGYSFSLLFVELEFAYSGRTLPPVDSLSPCRFLAAEQRYRYETGAMQKSIDYYRGIIPSDLKPIELFPFAKSKRRPVLDRYGHWEAKTTISSLLSAKLKLLARKNGSTAFHVYLAALQVLVFNMLPDMDDFCIGIADANRKEKNYMYSLGFFLNLLPLHFKRSNLGISIGNLVSETRKTVFAALEHSDLPFDVLLQELRVGRSNTHTPIFQLFVDHRQVYRDRAVWGGCKTSDETWRDARTGYDVAFQIHEAATGPSMLSLHLQDGLYSKQSTELLLRSFSTILEAMTNDVDATIDTLPLWDPEDIQKALKLGKGLELKSQWPATISHRVDDMISLHGTKPALQDGLGNHLTYDEMNLRVNTITAALLKAGVSSEAKVAVFQAPSSDWICSILAIFKVGATYIPFDLRNYIGRLKTIFRAAQPAMILTDMTTTSKIKAIGADGTTEINLAKLETDPSLLNLPNNAKPESTAIVLFTSGTTGEPKGVIMKHSNLTAHFEGNSKYCDLPFGNLVVMQQSTFSFDVSIDQTFVALADGGCLYVVPADKRGDPHEISKIMLEQGVTYTSGTPSEYELLLEYAHLTLAKCTKWRFSFAGGEYLSPTLVRQFATLPLPNLKLFNCYGPAEITNAALKDEIDYRGEEIEAHTIAGYVLPNYTMYFVDRNLRPVPIGVPGEIVIGGPGVTAGYLNNEGMTRAHYIPNTLDPSASNTAEQLYRTGDLGHLREDGAVYWDSRIGGDNQVKLRGFRIELAEIEAVIVKQAMGSLLCAVVTLRGEGEGRFLAAHVVFSPSYPNTKRQDLLDELKTTLPLPPYMRPSVFAVLADKPLTAHLKLDRKAVQAMALPEGCQEESDTTTLTEKEAKLVHLWQQVVPHEISGQLTSNMDFFNIGGNSLLLVKLQSLVKTNMHSAPRLIDMMNASTLSAMAETITFAEKAHCIDWDFETAVPSMMIPAGKATPANVSEKEKQSLTVAIAGATGYLGRHVLSRLIQSPQVEQIFCLVRNEEKALALKSSPKVQLVAADLASENLGLDNASFSRLAQTVDSVVHCAANRSFWDSYENLKLVNLGSVKELARMAQANNAALHVLSSGAVLTYADGLSPPADGSDGYVASKWAAEAFLQKASSQLGLRVLIHRPSSTPASLQPTDAAAAQALASLVDSACDLGKIPDFGSMSGHVDFAPVNEVADRIAASIVADATGAGVHVVAHEGNMRVHTQEFADHLEAHSTLSQLPLENALDWFGEAKKTGFDFLITSQDLVMASKNGEELRSRR